MWRQFVNIVKKAFFVRLACIVLALGMAIPAWTTGNKIRTVVIDPGHGGKDPGAVGSAGHEKDIVLAIGLKLGAYIRESFPDVKIVFTRDTDVFIPLHERAGLANKHDADLFISIHANANTKPEIDGTETYVMGMHKTESNLEVAKLENSVIFLEEDHSENYEGFDPNSSESYIIFELIQSIYMRQSLHLANNIQDQFRDRVQRKDRGVKQAGFLVLWQTAMPSVLVETGYITNRDEEKFMLSENGQDYLASAIFRAFRDYKTKLESSSVILPDKITDNQPTTNTPADTAKHSGTDLAAKYPATESNLIFFRVQLTSSQQIIPPDSKYFKGIEGVIRLRAGNGYKYTTGEYSSYESCKARCEEIKEVFPGAFVVATQGDEFIPLKKALKKP